MCSLCWLTVAKNHNFWQILTFWGAPLTTPFSDEDRIWCAIADPRHTLTCQIWFRLVYSVALWQWNPPPIFAIFSTSAFSDVASWQQSEKVEHGCTTTNLPLSNRIKIVSVLQRLHGKTGHKLWCWKAWRTDKKTQRFWPPRWRVKSEPYQTWHSDRGPWAHSCTSKTFAGLTHSFAPRGAENLGIIRPRQLKTPITP